MLFMRDGRTTVPVFVRRQSGGKRCKIRYYSQPRSYQRKTRGEKNMQKKKRQPPSSATPDKHSTHRVLAHTITTVRHVKQMNNTAGHLPNKNKNGTGFSYVLVRAVFPPHLHVFIVLEAPQLPDRHPCLHRELVPGQQPPRSQRRRGPGQGSGGGWRVVGGSPSERLLKAINHPSP